MVEFGSFLEDLELVDLNLLGRRFTWYQPNGRAMSRLDRILISDEWANRWGNCSLWALPRDVSDHCPLILKYLQEEWGPKPFRFKNFWLENKKFVKEVETFWRNYRVEGWMGFVLKERLKGLKFFIKSWTKLEYGSMETKIKELVTVIKDLDIKGEGVGLSSQEVSSRKEKFEDLWRTLKNKEAITFQRSRSKWLKEGDGNTKYFHGCVKARRRANSLSALKVDEGWVESPALIKAAVSSYFEKHVASTPRMRPKLDGV
ncbi:hypothetical protein P8452_07455 [Trifolium repens]|nr:hypothetical protein P8452_07455 [Trifolium repens]